MVSRPIKHLLSGLIDYAGLFPPAKLPMGDAVAEFARQRSSDHAWVLAKFVVPTSRLEEFSQALGGHHHGDGCWSLSALVQCGDDQALAAQAASLEAFNLQHSGRACVDAIETKPGSIDDIGRVARHFSDAAGRPESTLDVFYELPHAGDPEQLRAMMKSVREHGGRGKIRTGGIVPELIPDVAQVADFLLAAQRARLPFKATAGLHHPMRGCYALTYEPDSAESDMHGFLNLFLAAAFLFHDHLDRLDLKELLAERSPGAIEASTAGFSWRGHRLSSEELATARRDFIMSYGSCSFQEPLDDLRALQLI